MRDGREGMGIIFNQSKQINVIYLFNAIFPRIEIKYYELISQLISKIPLLPYKPT